MWQCWLQVVLMVLPGGDGVPIVDPCGLTALAVMRAMGVPTLIPLVQSQPGAASMKQRAADRKQAAAALEPQVSNTPPPNPSPASQCSHHTR